VQIISNPARRIGKLPSGESKEKGPVDKSAGPESLGEDA
jgi:hypothetical protein